MTSRAQSLARRTCGALLLAAMLVAGAGTVFADEAADVRTLEQNLHAFLAGASVNDAGVHRDFWDDELVYTSSTGHRFGKQEILDSLEQDDPGPSVRYNAEDIRIRVYGDTAVVAFRLVGVSENVETQRLEYLNTGTFARRENGWKAVAWQATRAFIPEDESS